VQAAAAPLSSWHVTTVGDPPVTNVTGTFADLMNTPLAGDVIDTNGGPPLVVTDALPTLPAWSVADTVKVWLPAASPE
jgi:hypothetical protein